MPPLVAGKDRQDHFADHASFDQQIYIKIRQIGINRSSIKRWQLSK